MLSPVQKSTKSAKFRRISEKSPRKVELKTPATKPKRCLLSLPTETHLMILDNSDQGDKAALARTCSALTNVSRSALFRNPELGSWDNSLGFRKACDSDKNLKNTIQSLKFPFTDDWFEWFQSNYSLANMSSLRHLEMKAASRTDTTGTPTLNHDLWEAFVLTSEIAPQARVLSLDTLPAPTQQLFPAACLPALRQLDLVQCPVDTNILRLLARDLPALEILDLQMPDNHSIRWDGIQALTEFQSLTKLRLVGLSVFDELKPVGPGPFPIFEFRSLIRLCLYPEWGLRHWNILKQLSLPKLRHLDVIFSPEHSNLADAPACLTCSVRMPVLSAIVLMYFTEHIPGTPFPPTPPKMRRLLSPLKKMGFCFKYLKISGIDDGITFKHYRGVKGDYKLEREDGTIGW